MSQAETPTNPPITAEEDDYEDDSAYADSITSSTASLSSSILQYRKENGRTYHAYKDGSYALPNDEGENDRLDHQHHLLTLMQDGKLYQSPIDDGIPMHRVLDVGTGTGIWAIDFADTHPESQVLGIDLSPIQPSFVPPNLKFQIDDVEEEWTHNKAKFDFIYPRMMTGAISNWTKFFKQSFDNLTPGGYIEVCDAVYPCRCDDGSMKSDSAIYKWSEYALKGTTDFGRPLDSALRYEELLEEVGFVNIEKREFIWPINRWPKDAKLKELGMCTQENLSSGMEGLSQVLFCRWFGWSVEEMQVFLVDVRKDLADRKIHAYFPIWIFTAQKPVEKNT